MRKLPDVYSLISRTQKCEFQSKRCLEMDSRAFFLIQRQLIIYLFELITTFSRSRSRSHFFINSAEPDSAFFITGGGAGAVPNMAGSETLINPIPDGILPGFLEIILSLSELRSSLLFYNI